MQENFDAEIKSYKEYLEKIYEICVECKSKVNFEITKQNGILKQYFLNLGNFDYFYEKPQSSTLNVHNKAHSVVGSQQVYTLNTNTPYFQGKLNLFLSVASYLVIFILASLILAYNEYNDLMINGKRFFYVLVFFAKQVENFRNTYSHTLDKDDLKTVCNSFNHFVINSNSNRCLAELKKCAL